MKKPTDQSTTRAGVRSLAPPGGAIPRVDQIDWEILEFVVSWAPFGGPDPEEALPRFGMTCEQLSQRFAQIVAEAGPFEARLDRPRRALLRRARQLLDSSSGGRGQRPSESDRGKSPDPAAMPSPGNWVVRRGVWHWR
ncbi:hypothetical protein [[Mycobacterium] burgundiense]|uniref:DUF3263 domain-containing protein n=1 Tax=[Mycobacterium] burgundiense TaxID=3064286 RepID=A0ABN9N634_9MYCO|nr:hypothetical protein [Mycolicibacterium sp. MU0053]CAJ1501080.1 hypothetical protein MU0053_001836 [Mycolicibacterium sp. MU0053]